MSGGLLKSHVHSLLVAMRGVGKAGWAEPGHAPDNIKGPRGSPRLQL